MDVEIKYKSGRIRTMLDVNLIGMGFTHTNPSLFKVPLNGGDTHYLNMDEIEEVKCYNK